MTTRAYLGIAAVIVAAGALDQLVGVVAIVGAVMAGAVIGVVAVRRAG